MKPVCERLIMNMAAALIGHCSFLKLKLEAAKNSKPGSFIYR